ncbi:MAG: hypothetical protein JNL01_00615 [Bdellovibrionales bacterium]|nr:hypothetical protein [Bdellovibrionales bacterium]
MRLKRLMGYGQESTIKKIQTLEEARQKLDRLEEPLALQNLAKKIADLKGIQTFTQEVTVNNMKFPVLVLDSAGDADLNQVARKILSGSKIQIAFSAFTGGGVTETGNLALLPIRSLAEPGEPSRQSLISSIKEFLLYRNDLSTYIDVMGIKTQKTEDGLACLDVEGSSSLNRFASRIRKIFNYDVCMDLQTREGQGAKLDPEKKVIVLSYEELVNGTISPETMQDLKDFYPEVAPSTGRLGFTREYEKAKARNDFSQFGPVIEGFFKENGIEFTQSMDLKFAKNPVYKINPKQNDKPGFNGYLSRFLAELNQMGIPVHFYFDPAYGTSSAKPYTLFNRSNNQISIHLNQKMLTSYPLDENLIWKMIQETLLEMTNWKVGGKLSLAFLRSHGCKAEIHPEIPSMVIISPDAFGCRLNKIAERLMYRYQTKMVWDPIELETKKFLGLHDRTNQRMYTSTESIQRIAADSTLLHEIRHVYYDRLLNEGLDGESILYDWINSSTKIHSENDAAYTTYMHLEELSTHTLDAAILMTQFRKAVNERNKAAEAKAFENLRWKARLLAALGTQVNRRIRSWYVYRTFIPEEMSLTELKNLLESLNLKIVTTRQGREYLQITKRTKWNDSNNDAADLHVALVSPLLVSKVKEYQTLLANEKADGSDVWSIHQAAAELQTTLHGILKQRAEHQQLLGQELARLSEKLRNELSRYNVDMKKLETIALEFRGAVKKAELKYKAAIGENPKVVQSSPETKNQLRPVYPGSRGANK